jgi:hypothetical protein
MSARALSWSSDAVSGVMVPNELARVGPNVDRQRMPPPWETPAYRQIRTIRGSKPSEAVAQGAQAGSTGWTCQPA